MKGKRTPKIIAVMKRARLPHEAGGFDGLIADAEHGVLPVHERLVRTRDGIDVDGRAERGVEQVRNRGEVGDEHVGHLEYAQG